MSDLPSGLPEVVGDSEPLVRFLLSRGHFAQDRVKPAAFIPDPYVELSVSRTLGLEFPSREIEHVGEDVANRAGKTLYGYASLGVEDFKREGLGVIPDEPPPRHANVTDWPANPDRALQKAAQKIIAMRLTNQVRIHLLNH